MNVHESLREYIESLSPGTVINFSELQKKFKEWSKEELKNAVYRLVEEGLLVEPGRAFGEWWIRSGKLHKPVWVRAGREASLAALIEIRPSKPFERYGCTVREPIYRCIAIVSDTYKQGEEFEFYEVGHPYLTWYDILEILTDDKAFKALEVGLEKIVDRYKERLKMLGVSGAKLGSFTRKAKEYISKEKASFMEDIKARDVERLLKHKKKLENRIKHEIYLPTLGLTEDEEKEKWKEMIRKELEENVVSKKQLLEKYPVPEYIDEILAELKPNQPYPDIYTFLKLPSEEEILLAIEQAKEPRKTYVLKPRVYNLLEEKGYEWSATSAVLDKLIEKGYVEEHKKETMYIRLTEEGKKKLEEIKRVKPKVEKLLKLTTKKSYDEYQGFKRLWRYFYKDREQVGFYVVYLEPDVPIRLVGEPIKPEKSIVKIDIHGFGIYNKANIETLQITEKDIQKLGWDEIKKRLKEYLGEYTDFVYEYLVKDFEEMKNYRDELIKAEKEKLPEETPLAEIEKKELEKEGKAEEIKPPKEVITVFDKLMDTFIVQLMTRGFSEEEAREAAKQYESKIRDLAEKVERGEIKQVRAMLQIVEMARKIEKPEKPKISKEEVINEIKTHIAEYLRRHGISESQIRKIISEAKDDIESIADEVVEGRITLERALSLAEEIPVVLDAVKKVEEVEVEVREREKRVIPKEVITMPAETEAIIQELLTKWSPISGVKRLPELDKARAQQYLPSYIEELGKKKLEAGNRENRILKAAAGFTMAFAPITLVNEGIEAALHKAWTRLWPMLYKKEAVQKLPPTILIEYIDEDGKLRRKELPRGHVIFYAILYELATNLGAVNVHPLWEACYEYLTSQ